MAVAALQRERNKPINRLRARRARRPTRSANAFPTPEEAAPPAIGLGTAVASILLLVWQHRSSGHTRPTR